MLPDALRFCFDLVTDGTPLQGAVLDIEEPPGSAACRRCGTTFALTDLILLCPCGSADVEVLTRQGARHRFGRGGGGVNDVHDVRLR